MWIPFNRQFLKIRVLKNTNIHQTKVEMKEKLKTPTINEKKKIEREREREREREPFCMGKICIKWERVANL